MACCERVGHLPLHLCVVVIQSLHRTCTLLPVELSSQSEKAVRTVVSVGASCNNTVQPLPYISFYLINYRMMTILLSKIVNLNLRLASCFLSSLLLFLFLPIPRSIGPSACTVMHFMLLCRLVIGSSRTYQVQGRWVQKGEREGRNEVTNQWHQSLKNGM